MQALIPVFMLSGFVVLVAFLWTVTTYNRFVKYRNRIESAWSDIDVSLKRRLNLVTNLVEAVKGYEDHEAEIMAMGRRAVEHPGDVPGREAEEGRISRSLNGLLALAEAYPDLKASANFLSLQESLVQIESDIQGTRNRYNQAVLKLNTLVESFPSRWIARKNGFEKVPYFTLELATERELPEVDFGTSDRDAKKGPGTPPPAPPSPPGDRP